MTPAILRNVDFSSKNDLTQSISQKDLANANAAWIHFFRDPFDADHALKNRELLIQSLEGNIHELGGDPLTIIAKTAHGARMRFANELYTSAIKVRPKRLFKKGSLAKIAMENGNSQGAIDSAMQNREFATSYRDSRGITLLAQAMLQGDLNMIERLTVRVSGKSITDPFAADKDGNTALMTYLRHAKRIDIKVLNAYGKGLIESRMLAHEASAMCINHYQQLNSFGNSAFHVLADRLNQPSQNTTDDFIDAFRWLGQRADINIPNLKDKTAFMLACGFGDSKIVSAIESLGGDIAWISTKGMSALSSAMYYNKAEIVNKLFELDRVKVLFTISELTEERAGEKLSIPLVAARQGSWEALQAYLAHTNQGLDVASYSDDQKTPLIYAIKAVEQNTVEALIEGGADVNHPDAYGMTPLHYAALNFSENSASGQIFYQLLNAGANLSKMDSEGRSPIDIIMRNGNFQSSQEFVYKVNLGQIASWSFENNVELAKKYVDSSPYAMMACENILTKQNPLCLNADQWMAQHKKQESESKVNSIRQGFQHLNMMLGSSATMAWALYTLAESGEYEIVNNVVNMVPPDWRMPAIGFASISAILIQSTMGGTNMEPIKSIGAAAMHVIRKLDNGMIRGFTERLKDAKESEKGALGRMFHLCVEVKQFCQRVCSACVAFTRVMKREQEQPRTASQMISQLDDRLISDIANLSRQEFHRLHAEARHYERQKKDDNAPSI